MSWLRKVDCDDWLPDSTCCSLSVTCGDSSGYSVGVRHTGLSLITTVPNWRQRHLTCWPIVKHFRFVFEKYCVWISARTPTILIEVFHGFPHYLHAYTRLIFQLGHYHFLSNPFPFISDPACLTPCDLDIDSNRDRGSLQNKDTNSVFTWQIIWQDFIQSLLFYIQLKITNYNSLQFTVCIWYTPCRVSVEDGWKKGFKMSFAASANIKRMFPYHFKCLETPAVGTWCLHFFRHIHVCFSEHTGKVVSFLTLLLVMWEVG